MTDTFLRLTPLQRLARGGRWRTEAMRSYSEPLLLWFTRGQGRMTVGGVTRGYGSHNAVFIPAGMMHGFDVSSQVYGTAVFFGTASGLDLPQQPVHLRIRDAAAQSEMTAILEHLQREADGQRPARKRAMLHHAGLMTVWLERQLLENDDALATHDATRRLARRYATLVEQGFHTSRSVSDYATDLDVSPTHLTRVCKAACGRTASDLLADRKIAEARRLLVDTRRPVKDIAASLGFASPAYFTRAFHARTGKSPVNFRKFSGENRPLS